MTEQEKQEIRDQIELLKIKRDITNAAYTVQDDLPKIKRTYKSRGNKF